MEHPCTPTPTPSSHARLPSRASSSPAVCARLHCKGACTCPPQPRMPVSLVEHRAPCLTPALSRAPSAGRCPSPLSPYPRPSPPPYPCTRALVFAHPACPHMPTRTPACPHARIRACIPVHPVTPAPRRTAPSPLSSGAQCEGATGTGSLLWLFLRWRRRLRLERPRATGAGHTSAQQAVARPRDHFTPKWGRRDPLYTEMGKT